MRNRTSLRYAVVISDSGLPESRSRIRHSLTLPKAWRIVRREVRRGFNLFGGGIAYENWGGRGGVFPDRYRSAVIIVDGETLAHRTRRIFTAKAWSDPFVCRYDASPE